MDQICSSLYRPNSLGIWISELLDLLIFHLYHVFTDYRPEERFRMNYKNRWSLECRFPLSRMLTELCNFQSHKTASFEVLIFAEKQTSASLNILCNKLYRSGILELQAWNYRYSFDMKIFQWRNFLSGWG